MGRLFQVKSQVLLYDRVLSQKEIYLSDEEIKPILANYEKVKKIAETGFWDKLSESMRILLFELHPYEKAWIFFSILLPILLLKKVEGAQYAIWILPLLSGVYCLDNTLAGKLVVSKEAALFPTENYLIENYMKEPFSNDILVQHEQLQRAWDLYLIREWALEEPSEANFDNQVKKGEFFFTVERVKNLPEIKSEWRTKHSAFFLLLHIWWHLFGAFICFKHRVNADSKQQPSY